MYLSNYRLVIDRGWLRGKITKKENRKENIKIIPFEFIESIKKRKGNQEIHKSQIYNVKKKKI